MSNLFYNEESNILLGDLQWILFKPREEPVAIEYLIDPQTTGKETRVIELVQSRKKNL